MPLVAHASLVEQTFAQLRHCGAGARECQALWLGPWSTPEMITEVVHPGHSASPVGFDVDPAWLDRFWRSLADRSMGIRVQVHTHPGRAYHSAIDDAFPIIHTPGFLSLVIPRFAQGPACFDGAYLAQIDERGQWRKVAISDHLEIV